MKTARITGRIPQEVCRELGCEGAIVVAVYQDGYEMSAAVDPLSPAMALYRALIADMVRLPERVGVEAPPLVDDKVVV